MLSPRLCLNAPFLLLLPAWEPRALLSLAVNAPCCRDGIYGLVGSCWCFMPGATVSSAKAALPHLSLSPCSHFTQVSVPALGQFGPSAANSCFHHGPSVLCQAERVNRHRLRGDGLLLIACCGGGNMVRWFPVSVSPGLAQLSAWWHLDTSLGTGRKRERSLGASAAMLSVQLPSVPTDFTSLFHLLPCCHPSCTLIL